MAGGPLVCIECRGVGLGDSDGEWLYGAPAGPVKCVYNYRCFPVSYRRTAGPFWFTGGCDAAIRFIPVIRIWRPYFGSLVNHEVEEKTDQHIVLIILTNTFIHIQGIGAKPNNGSGILVLGNGMLFPGIFQLLFPLGENFSCRKASRNPDGISLILTRRIFPGLSRRIRAGECFRNSEIQRSILIQIPIDLRYILYSLGFKGGLKGCEKQLGMDRGDLSDSELILRR